MACLLTSRPFVFVSIQPEHCEIKNEDSQKITIKTCGEAKVLVNGEPVDDDEEEELHHLDRFFFFTLFYCADRITGHEKT